MQIHSHSRTYFRRASATALLSALAFATPSLAQSAGAATQDAASLGFRGSLWVANARVAPPTGRQANREPPALFGALDAVLDVRRLPFTITGQIGVHADPSDIHEGDLKLKASARPFSLAGHVVKAELGLERWVTPSNFLAPALPATLVTERMSVGVGPLQAGEDVYLRTRDHGTSFVPFVSRIQPLGSQWRLVGTAAVVLSKGYPPGDGARSARVSARLSRKSKGFLPDKGTVTTYVEVTDHFPLQPPQPRTYRGLTVMGG
jgi:hypothetical protein